MKLSLESDNHNISISYPESDLEDEIGRYNHYEVAMLFADLLGRMKIPRPLSVVSEVVRIMDEDGEFRDGCFHPDKHAMVVQAASDYLESWREKDRELGLI